MQLLDLLHQISQLSDEIRFESDVVLEDNAGCQLTINNLISRKEQHRYIFKQNLD